jgi:3'-phosphoadenosine 5'-phosphosulfate sulfotransferase (PAPS reductase)/FAD synthetase
VAFQSPFDQPEYRPKSKKTKKKVAKKARKKVAKKKAKKARKKKAKKARKKLPIAETPATEVCGLPGSDLPEVELARHSYRARQKKPRTRGKRCRDHKGGRVGKTMSGWTFVEYAKDKWSVEDSTCIAPTGSNREAVAESRAMQQALWADGYIPDLYPNGPYRPGRRTSHGYDYEAKRLTKTGLAYGIPASYGMPDVAWFIDPRIAGDQAGKIVVFFSGGKDSIAALLYVIEIVLSLGLDPSQTIECIHHCVDGRPWFFGGGGKSEFDWPVTEDYCRVICACLGIPLLFNWREGGLMGEVLKGGKGDPVPALWRGAKIGPRLWEDAKRESTLRPTSPMHLQMPGGQIRVAGGIGEASIRRSFPPHGPVQKGGKTYRWCSAVAKIDLGRSHISNRRDFYWTLADGTQRGKRILTISGERAEESKARGHYLAREFDGGHGTRGRHVERWRPIHRWCELDVWALIYRWRIRPHPAYQLGWGRLSCMTCIFGGPDAWASVGHVQPSRLARFVQVEKQLERDKANDAGRLKAAYKSGEISKATYDKAIKSVSNRIVHIKGEGLPLSKVAGKGKPYKAMLSPAGRRLMRVALSHDYTLSPILHPWKLPAGAFGEASGPI